MTKSRANDQQYSHLLHQQTLLQLLYLQQYRELCYWIYIHTDALGSVDTVTDNHGAIVLRNEYTPYGENITNLADASSYNHLFANEELRGYTGHRQIPEANLINMNARIYDPFIARFTSPDTMIPHPDMIQSYNRYAYVYGNPIKYSDPSGHFIWFVVGAAIFTVAATSDNPTVQMIGMAVGRLMMMGADLGMTTMAQGATVGFTTGFISSGGDFGQAIMSGFTSAVGAELSFQIGHGFGHDWGTLGQAVAHGISQGVITQIRGGKFNGGFISAFISKLTGGALQKLGIDGDDAGEIALGTAATAIMGGVASEASGGSFYDGAVSAAVVYLYNELGEMHPKYYKNFNALKKTKEGRELLKQVKSKKTAKINIYAVSTKNIAKTVPVRYNSHGIPIEYNIYISHNLAKDDFPINTLFHGIQNASITRLLVHELGHALSGRDDHGTLFYALVFKGEEKRSGMYIVSTYENDIMYNIDEKLRSGYSFNPYQNLLEYY